MNNFPATQKAEKVTHVNKALRFPLSLFYLLWHFRKLSVFPLVSFWLGIDKAQTDQILS